MSDITDTELDAIEDWCARMLIAYGKAPKATVYGVCDYNDEFPTHSLRSQVLALVAALRSDRRDFIALERSKDMAIDELFKERHAASLVLAELERERTQNRELRAALQELDDAASAIDFAKPGQLSETAGWRLIHAGDAARAVLSTQEPPK